ncbi:MAG TPA: hypothetical protein DIC64_05520 [Alphaproteobacteria bacterium]|nr:hypothetical protein [Alphaproteobacteria bacterium]
MFKLLKWVFGIVSFLIVAAIIGLVIFISQFDLNEYKPQIEKIVYEQTGRKLALNGDIEIKISLVPTVALKDATLSNADWAKDNEMLKIKEADVTLSVLPLLNKELEIEEINIISPVINLMANAQGVGNWVFEKPQETQEQINEEAKPQEESSAAAAPLLAGFVAKKLYIENGVLNYEDLKTKSKTNLTIKSLELASENMDSEIDLAYDVVFNGEDIKGTAKASSLQKLLNNEPYNVSLDTKAYGANLKAKALLTDLMGELKFDADVDAISPDGNFDLPKVEAVANVKGDLKEIVAKIAKLDFGGNIVEGNIKVNIAGSKPIITGNVASNLINVMKLSTSKKSAELSFISTASAASYMPAEKLDLSALKTFDANVKFDVKKLIINEDISLDNVKGTADVKNGVLSINPLGFVAGGGNVNGNVAISAANNALTLNLDGKDIVLQNFLKNLNPANESTFGFKSGGQTNLHIAVKSNGATYQNLVENLDGQVLFVIGKSQLQAGALKYLKGNFITQLLSALKLEAKDPKMSMKCAVLRADLAKGKANFPKGIVFDSKKMMVVGDGDINLKNDKINIAIKPFNGNLTDTNIAQAISSLVKISGTVQNPGIAIDTASVVKNVVGVAMTGPAFIGSQLLLDADQAPCYTALKGTIYKDMFEAPTGVQAGAQSAYQGASDLVSSGINMITGTAGNAASSGAGALGDAAKGMFNMLTGNSSKKNK